MRGHMKVDYITCLCCKHAFGYFEDRRNEQGYLNWLEEVIIHVNSHVKLTFANVEKELLNEKTNPT